MCGVCTRTRACTHTHAYPYVCVRLCACVRTPYVFSPSRCVCLCTHASRLYMSSVCIRLTSSLPCICVCVCRRASRLYMCVYILDLLFLAAVYVYVCASYVFSPSGSWTKLPRSLRMRDKRADFVVGSLGGNIVAIGGLGKSAELRERRYEEQKRVSLEGPPSLDSGVRALSALCPSVNQGACGCPSS